MNRLILAATAVAILFLGLVVFRAKFAPEAEKAAESKASSEGAGAFEAPLGGLVEFRADPLPEATGDFSERATRIATMPPDTAREEAVRTLAQEWAAHSRVDAERWAASLTDPSERERALTHVCLETAARDPQEAIATAEWYRLDGIIEAIAGRWAETDFDAAAGWANALPDGESRDRILSRLVLSHAAADPAEAAQIVADAFSSGEMQQEAAMAVIHRWSLDDPSAAAEWVAVFPPGPFKTRAEEEIRGAAEYRREVGND